MIACAMCRNDRAKPIPEKLCHLNGIDTSPWNVPNVRVRSSALLTSYVGWYHEHRPHQGLGGRTPNEVCFGETPANEKPRIEPRVRWPRRSPCALPAAPPRGRRGRVVELVVEHRDADARLPIVELSSAA
jgi:hypothetical protein